MDQTASGSDWIRHLHIVATDLRDLHSYADFANFGTPGIDPLEPWKYSMATWTKSQEAESVQAAMWEELLVFVQSLHGLEDLTWAIGEQIPIALLNHLNRSSPLCRLHLRTFDLESLVRPRGEPILPSNDDLILATSPCLWSISRLAFAGAYTDHTDQAIYEMAAGAAPNLREVNLSLHFAGNTLELQQSLSIPQVPWQAGLIGMTGARGAVQALILEGIHAFSDLQAWQSHTDFTKLRSLKFYNHLEGEHVMWLSTQCHFPSLRELALDADLQSDTVTNLILGLPPLEHLELYGTNFEPALLRLLDHCGLTLRRLYCTDALLTPEVLATLTSKTPHIEQLGLNMLRDEGSSREVSLYQGLGKLNRLEKLSLSLLSRIATKDITPEWGVDLLSTIFKNLAIDQDLARSIYATIAASRSLSYPPLSHLELKMNATPIGAYVGGDLGILLEMLDQSWLCSHDPRGGPNCCTVKHCFPDPEADDEPAMIEEFDKPLKGPYAHAIFKTWPKAREGNLLAAWHSFPLYKSDSTEAVASSESCAT